MEIILIGIFVVLVHLTIGILVCSFVVLLVADVAISIEIVTSSRNLLSVSRGGLALVILFLAIGALWNSHGILYLLPLLLLIPVFAPPVRLLLIKWIPLRTSDKKGFTFLLCWASLPAVLPLVGLCAFGAQTLFHFRGWP